MKRTLLFLITGIFMMGSFIFPQKDPRKLIFSDIEFKPIKPQLVQVAPGIQLYYDENSELPAISGSIIFKNGSLADPIGKIGLASLTMRLLKSGGTTTITPEKLDESIDFLGSYIYTYAGTETSQINFWTLSKNFSETWKIFSDIILNPGFSSERLDLEKKEVLEYILRRWDNPRSVGRYFFRKLLYGADFPEARLSSKESIEAITKKDIIDFYASQYKNREIIISLTGDFKIDTILGVLKKSLKSWKGLPYKPIKIPPVEIKAKPGIYLINKEDLTQAVICMGHLGINRLDPDNVELEILNFILGTGGKSSRIMREVRSNRGLAYSAYGYVGRGRDKGLFFNYCQTKNQSAGEAIHLIRNIIKNMTLKHVNKEELETAKKYQLNSFVHKFESAQAVIDQAINYKLQGYPDDFLETYIPRIKKVGLEKVLQMAKRIMKPEQLVILVVGKKVELMDQLKALNMGEIKEIPLPKF